jgi:hypothetical protein
MRVNGGQGLLPSQPTFSDIVKHAPQGHEWAESVPRNAPRRKIPREPQSAARGRILHLHDHSLLIQSLISGEQKRGIIYQIRLPC